MLSILISLSLFLLFNVAIFAGAWHWANFGANGKASQFLFILIWATLGLGTIVFGVLGSCGWLNGKAFCLAAWSAGGIALASFYSQKRPFSLELPAASLPERFAAAGFAALWFSIAVPSITERMGTDTLLYHLYYPATWISHGTIFPVSIAGLPHEYFPVYGEMAYGWLMMPFADASLAGLLQPLALFAALMGMVMLANALKLHYFPALLAGAFLLAQPIIAVNASYCYTDVLTGALILSGTVLAIAGSRHGVDWKTAVSAGTLLGVACGVKYSGLVAVPIIAIMFFCYFFKQKTLRKYAASLLGSAFFWGLLAYLPNWIRTGNPFYPVKIGALFPHGIEFHRPAIRAVDSLLGFFIRSDAGMTMTVASLTLFALLFVGFPVWFFAERRRKNGSRPDNVWLLLWSMTLIILLAHYFFYPCMAGVRQLIPALMLLSVLWIPVLQSEQTWFRWTLFALVTLFCVAERWKTQVIFMSTWYLVLLAMCLAAAFFWKRKGLAIAFSGIFAVILVSIPFISAYQMRCFFGTAGTLISGPGRSNAVKILIDRMSDKPARIAAVATWHNFHFLNNMPENDLFYVPIGKANTTHPHEVEDWRELREPAVSPAEWLKRLHDAKADYLAIDLDAHQDYLNNPDWELKTALAHPEHFELLVKHGGFAFFGIK